MKKEFIQRIKKYDYAYYFILPTLLGMFLIHFIPMVQGIYMAFLKLNQKYPLNYLEEQIRLEIARCEIELNNLTDALGLLADLRKSKKAEIRAQAGLGRAECLLRKNRQQEAIRALTHIIWDFPDETGIIDQAALRAAEICENIGDYSEAVKYYRIIIHIRYS